MLSRLPNFFFFFFNDTATTEIYTLSLHDALPISALGALSLKTLSMARYSGLVSELGSVGGCLPTSDRKSTRLNSSHSQISYAVFCLKKKKKNTDHARVSQRVTTCQSS